MSTSYHPCPNCGGMTCGREPDGTPCRICGGSGMALHGETSGCVVDMIAGPLGVAVMVRLAEGNYTSLRIPDREDPPRIGELLELTFDQGTPTIKRTT